VWLVFSGGSAALHPRLQASAPSGLIEGAGGEKQRGGVRVAGSLRGFRCAAPPATALRPFGANREERGTKSREEGGVCPVPGVPLRYTPGYSPSPLWGELLGRVFLRYKCSEGQAVGMNSILRRVRLSSSTL